MTKGDVYQRLFQEYSAFKIDMTRESMMEVLRLQFTPQEAELAINVGFRPKKLEVIQRKTGADSVALKRMLSTMARKGTIYATPETQDPEYRLIGLGGPGLIETGGWGNIRFAHSVPLMKAMYRWQVDLAEKWFPSLGIPVTRVWTTPAALPKDARPEENLAEIMKKAGSWGVSTCSCRLPHWIADPGHHCAQELETCLFMGEMAKWGSENGMCRLITYDEALEVVHRSNRNGLVHTHDPAEFLCNCCRDCCIFFVSLRLTGTLPLEPSEFVASIDEDTCSACGACVDCCPVKAITVEDAASIDAGKCLGCGVCYPTCSSKSVRFVRRAPIQEARPAPLPVPQERER